MTTENEVDLMQEELASASTTIEKQMLLQKYGMIEPKLTEDEKNAIKAEELGQKIDSLLPPFGLHTCEVTVGYWYGKEVDNAN